MAANRSAVLGRVCVAGAAAPMAAGRAAVRSVSTFKVRVCLCSARVWGLRADVPVLVWVGGWASVRAIFWRHATPRWQLSQWQTRASLMTCGIFTSPADLMMLGCPPDYLGRVVFVAVSRPCAPHLARCTVCAFAAKLTLLPSPSPPSLHHCTRAALGPQGHKNNDAQDQAYRQDRARVRRHLHRPHAFGELSHPCTHACSCATVCPISSVHPPCRVPASSPSLCRSTGFQSNDTNADTRRSSLMR
jgi:hypothetical protein